MQRRGWRRRAAGWALALLAAGAAGWVGLERLRPPLLIRVTAQEQREAVQAVAQAEAPRVLIYHTHTYEAYQATETENYKPTPKIAPNLADNHRHGVGRKAHVLRHVKMIEGFD